MPDYFSLSPSRCTSAPTSPTPAAATTICSTRASRCDSISITKKSSATSLIRSPSSRLHRQNCFRLRRLTIQSVTVNKSAAKFETKDDKLIIPLTTAAHAGEKFDINIRYEAKPTKGLYFILPDKNYPDRPKQIWTQGESEDTRYYLPTYDYPNNRLTTETILTVPANWTTVANGKLINVVDAANGMKTWTWKESVPSSTYLITVVAGEFEEVKDSWRGIPVTYYAPKGRGDRLSDQLRAHSPDDRTLQQKTRRRLSLGKIRSIHGR